VYLSSVISLKWQLIGNLHCHLSEITELKYASLTKMIILEENFKWHLEAFGSELFILSPNPKPTNHRKLFAFLNFQKTSISMIYKIFSLMGNKKKMSPQVQGLDIVLFLSLGYFDTHTRTFFKMHTGLMVSNWWFFSEHKQSS